MKAWALVAARGQGVTAKIQQITCITSAGAMEKRVLSEYGGDDDEEDDHDDEGYSSEEDE